MNTVLFSLLLISWFSFAEEINPTSALPARTKKSASSFELCTEFVEKSGVRLQLGQVWFISGDNPKEAKQLTNYTVDYSDKPFAHIFSFANLPKTKLWLECVYFACGDAACSSENASSDPKSIYREIKNIPISCKSKVKTGNASRIEYFNCKYN